MFNKSLHNKIANLEWEIKWLKSSVVSLDKNINCLKGNHSWKAGIDDKANPYLCCEICYCLPEKPKAKG